MTDSSTFATTHEKLQILGDRLRAIAACPPGAMPKWRWKRLLAGDVAVYAAHLADHMGAEEDRGFFEDLATASPRFAHCAAVLRDQHDELRTMVEWTMRMVEELRDSDAVRAAIVALLDTVDAHEREESEAARDAYMTDLGGGD